MASDDGEDDELFQSCVSELLEDPERPAGTTIVGAGSVETTTVSVAGSVAGILPDAEDQCDPETCHASPLQPTAARQPEAPAKKGVRPLRKEDYSYSQENKDASRDSQDDEPSERNDSNRNIQTREPSWDALAGEERPVIRSVTYTRDQKCVIFASSDGVTIRVLDSLYELPSSLKRGKDDWTLSVPLKPDGATFAQMSCSMTLAVIRPDSPRCVHVYKMGDDLSNTAVLPLSAAVKRVELQEKVLVAMTVDLRLHVFHMQLDNPGVEPKISFITILNILHPTDSPRTLGDDGFCSGSYFDLSTNSDEPRLACKSFTGTPGSIRVYNPLGFHEVAIDSAPRLDRRNSPPPTRKVRRRLELVTTIDAHDHAVTRMVIGTSEQKSFLATCSSKGTSIRIYTLSEGKLMYEWYRGARACKISSLSW